MTTMTHDLPPVVFVPDWASLTSAVAERLATPLADPFAYDLVVAQGPGHQRSLSQGLARRFGVTAGVEFVSASQLRNRLERQLLGVEPDEDPWRGMGLLLAIDEVIAASLGDPLFAPVRHHLRPGEPRPGRRVHLSRRLARVQRRLLAQRPDVIEAWAHGDDVGPDGSPLPDHLRWHSELWRRVRTLMAPATDPLQRHLDLLDALATAPSLPRRVTVVGRDPLPSADVELIAALAQHTDVGVVQLDCPPPAHPLALRLGATRVAAARQWGHEPPPAAEHDQGAPLTVLGRLQSDIRCGIAPAPIRGLLADGSVQIHASHGPDRQVEVLREVLTGLFADDPTLEPRDVVVACCDLGVYATLIASQLGSSAEPDVDDEHPARRLRVQISRRSVAQPNPVLDAVRAVYGLSQARATWDTLMQLVALPVVAAKFGFTEDDLAALAELINAARISWGVDAAHRREQGFPISQPGTWAQGMDRIILGAAMGDDPLGWLGVTLPVAQLQSTQVGLAGRVAEFVSRVRFLLVEARQSAPLSEWSGRLVRALELLTQVERDDEWQVSHAMTQLHELAARSGHRDASYELGDILAIIDDVLQRPSAGRPNYANGSLLVCGLDDVAAVSHRVVCVLGLDDDHFPTRVRTDGDDPLAGSPRSPDADAAALSRQHLLDAILAASDTLVVVARGADERTNELVPAGVAMQDLIAACRLDPALDIGWPSDSTVDHRPQSGRPLVYLHTLQPYDPDNFRSPSGAPPFSFDRVACLGAGSAFDRHGVVVPAAPGWSQEFPSPLDDGPISLDDLVAFFRNPAQQLLKRSAGLSFKAYDDPAPTRLPADLPGLEGWQVGSRIVEGLLQGQSLDRLKAAERLRGVLPPSRLGDNAVEQKARAAARIGKEARGVLALPKRPLDVAAEVRSGRVVGRAVLHGEWVVEYTYSRLSGSVYLETWLTLVALAASGQQARGMLITRDNTVLIEQPSQPDSAALLDMLIGWYRAGLTRLLPLPPKLAALHAGMPVTRPTPERGQSSEEILWGREHDDDWGQFVGTNLTDLEAVVHPCGTFTQLAGAFWRPVRLSTRMAEEDHR